MHCPVKVMSSVNYWFVCNICGMAFIDDIQLWKSSIQCSSLQLNGYCFLLI